MKDGIHYFWVDACYIDKRDNAELNTALNCMFRQYQYTTKCYPYLSDVYIPDEVIDVQIFQIIQEDTFRRSQQFTPGWTLQDLFVLASIKFFSVNSKQLGSKIMLQNKIHEITQIPIRVLGKYNLREFSIDKRIGQVIGYRTTVKEDKARYLLGIFDIFLLLICSEGKEYVFRQLRKEIYGQAESLDSSTVAKVQKVTSIFHYILQLI